MPSLYFAILFLNVVVLNLFNVVVNFAYSNFDVAETENCSGSFLSYCPARVPDAAGNRTI
jgi:hypothetical protein